MTFIIILLLLGGKGGYTFNPYSLEKVEYFPRDCRHAEDGWTRCKKVRVTFGAIQSSRVVGMETGQGLPGLAPSTRKSEGPKVIYRFKPKGCREIKGDRLGRWECRDFWWRARQ